MIDVRLISAKETYPIRLQVLRKGLTLKDCIFKGDEDANTFHLGLYKNNLLIGVSTYMKQNNILFESKEQYQLRGMAILENHQGYNYGSLILTEGEQILKNLNVELLWFNAREKAITFYSRNNYNTIGDFFDIEGVGTHIIMSKKLID